MRAAAQQATLIMASSAARRLSQTHGGAASRAAPLQRDGSSFPNTFRPPHSYGCDRESGRVHETHHEKRNSGPADGRKEIALDERNKPVNRVLTLQLLSLVLGQVIQKAREIFGAAAFLQEGFELALRLGLRQFQTDDILEFGENPLKINPACKEDSLNMWNAAEVAEGGVAGLRTQLILRGLHCFSNALCVQCICVEQNRNRRMVLDDMRASRRDEC
jgi:hypothetical protein